MSDINLEPDFYVNKAFTEANHHANDVNNNQIELNKTNTVSEQIELKQVKEAGHDAPAFVYKEGGFGWIVGKNFV